MIPESSSSALNAGEIYHPESAADKKIVAFNLDSLPDDARRTELPRVKDYFSPERIKEARRAVRQKLFETELLTVTASDAQKTFCLLDLSHEWVIDSDKRIVLHAPRNRRDYSTLPASFPKIFISKTAAKYAGQSPQDAVNLLIAGEVERMLAESGATDSLDSFELEDFKTRLSFHLTLACRGFFQKNGAVLLWKFARAVHSAVPAAVCRFALLLRGPHADALDATIIWQNLEEISEIYESSPAVLPIFVGAMRQQITENFSGKLGAAACQRVHWLRLDARALSSGGILKTVKDSWFGGEVHPAAWTWLASRKYLWGQSLFHKCRDAKIQVAWLNLMGDLQVQPKLTVYRALLPVFVAMMTEDCFAPARLSLDTALFASFIEYANGKHRSQLGECANELQSAIKWWSSASEESRRDRKWNWFDSAPGASDRAPENPRDQIKKSLQLAN